MQQSWGFLDYLTRELGFLCDKSRRIWEKGTHEQKRIMVRDAIERARILSNLDNESKLKEGP